MQRSLHRRPKEYIAPSWSWASLNQYVNWTIGYLKPEEFEADILQAQCIPETDDSTGAVRDGSITLRGALVQGKYYSMGVGDSIEDLVSVNDIEQDFWADYPYEVRQYQKQEPKDGCFIFKLAPIPTTKKFVKLNDRMAQLRALVLRRSGSKNGYERIGYLETYAKEVFDWFEGQEKTVITIF